MRRTWFYSSGTLKLWSTTSRMRKPSDLQWDPSEMCENCLALQEVQLNPNSTAPGGNQDCGTCGSGEVIRKDEQREIVLMVENSVDRRISNLHASVLHAKVGPFGHPYEEPGLYHTCKHTDKLSTLNTDGWTNILTTMRHAPSSSPGIILIAVFTSFQFWACSNFQSRMKLLLSVTTGPWKPQIHNPVTPAKYGNTRKACYLGRWKYNCSP